MITSIEHHNNDPMYDSYGLEFEEGNKEDNKEL